MTLITTGKELKSLCGRLKKADFITVDTEFIRERTYWPRLCLVQVACQDDEAFAIDPLSEDMDLTPFFEIMHDKDILKVFHACRQDLEIFFNASGKLPAPIFDTQVAAMVCGYGEQVSYEALVNSVLRRHLDKSSRFTDWAQRPLTAKQIKYALADVTYLHKIFLHLAERIEKFERTAWIRDEMRALSDKENYINRPEDAWERIKLPNHKARTLCIVRELAAWREKLAQQADVPRGRILKDEAIAEIAAHPPATREALGRMRNVSAGFAASDRADEVLEAVRRGMDMDEKDGPARAPRAQLPPGLGPTIELLRVLLKLKCEEHEVAPKLLCTAADLELVAGFGKDAKVPAMSGWRYKIFGKDAVDLRDGKLSLAIENGRVKLIRAE